MCEEETINGEWYFSIAQKFGALSHNYILKKNDSHSQPFFILNMRDFTRILLNEFFF